MTYRRYPPDPPAHRTVWWLILLFTVVLLANLAHQGGIV